MATKAKTTTKPAPEAPTEPEMFYDIRTANARALVARYRFLEARREFYEATMGNVARNDELIDLKRALAKVKPENYFDAEALLKFAARQMKAMKVADSFDYDNSIHDMIENSRFGFFKARMLEGCEQSLKKFDARSLQCDDWGAA